MSNSGMNHLRLAGGILQLGGTAQIANAGGYATPYVFSLGMSPQYRGVMLAALSIPAHVTDLFSEHASPNLTLVPSGTLRYIRLEISSLKFEIKQTQKDIRLWPVDALAGYVNELMHASGAAVSARLGKILKETRDLPLPVRIEALAKEVRNLRFYKRMER